MVLNASLDGPKFVQLFQPVLTALRALGGSGRPTEVVAKVALDLRVTEHELSETMESGSARFPNLVAWARFYLAKAGLIDSSKRGVWTLTDRAREQPPLNHASALALFKRVHASMDSERRDTGAPEASEDEQTAPTSPTVEAPIGHREQVLQVLQALSPSGFERFCQRLLRESGFQEVNVTGRSGDEGIDGIGILQVNLLVSFKVLFQCKRYKGAVGSPQVRDFRGAMMGRADKGIMLTTGAFTADARREALRDGVPPIELVDGPRLVAMLEELELGLKPVQAFALDTDFFADFGDQSRVAPAQQGGAADAASRRS